MPLATELPSPAARAGVRSIAAQARALTNPIASVVPADGTRAARLTSDLTTGKADIAAVAHGTRVTSTTSAARRTWSTAPLAGPILAGISTGRTEAPSAAESAVLTTDLARARMALHAAAAARVLGRGGMAARPIGVARIGRARVSIVAILAELAFTSALIGGGSSKTRVPGPATLAASAGVTGTTAGRAHVPIANWMIDTNAVFTRLRVARVRVATELASSHVLLRLLLGHVWLRLFGHIDRIRLCHIDGDSTVGHVALLSHTGHIHRAPVGDRPVVNHSIRDGRLARILQLGRRAIAPNNKQQNH